VRFALDSDQEQLREVVRDFLASTSSSEQVRKAIETSPGYDTALWQRLGKELDLLGVNLPERFGGSGSSFVELAVVLRELGRVVEPGPFFSTIVLAAGALVASGDERAQESWLPRLASGECTAAFAVAEPGTGTELATLAGTLTNALTTAARLDGGDWSLSGTKQLVCHGASADLLVVLASTEDGPALFTVAGDTAGVSRASPVPFDLTRRLATVAFENAPAELVGEPGTGVDITRRTLDRAAVALACEQVGGAQRCLETATDYAKDRVQFGRPIGSFQAIKHMLADVLVEVESAAAAADYAAWVIDNEPDEIPYVASLAKAFASDTYLLAAKTNIQVHGGIGFTWEHDAHLQFRRATAGKQFLGSPEEHRERLAAHLLD
jgi:alkylation response protein AidB-like acyl-CoA dehydrogenase